MLSVKKHKRRKKSDSVALEPLFRATKEALIHDLDVDVNYSQGNVGSREVEYASYTASGPHLFKRFKQVLDFDKRLIYSSDTSFDTLTKDALRKFRESQAEFHVPEPLNQRENLVIAKSREICAAVLGTFSYDSWFDSCSFGKRAAVGLPYAKSYLDVRFDRLSGTEMQWAAFDHCLSRDMHLFRAVRERLTTRKTVNEISVTAVPKSFKSARIIAPDTILGGFLSRGLGDYIRWRLEKETHINLSKQQYRHRLWARNASLKGHLATIDMSKASDSFTWRHIQLIVPEDWHHALDCVRTRRCNVDGDVVDLTSYMLMGSGHTFPLQTLLFYCLAEATRLLLKRRGRVSVYGDDIIVPTSMSTHLIAVFSSLGFTINSDKSFYDEPDTLRPSYTFFRESCGGDYKGGIDVRPYMPECDLQREGRVPRGTFIAWCHKIINGLLDRWEACEIPLTLNYLLNAINSMKRSVCFVPAWEVDHAGIRHYIPPYLLIGRECSYIKYEDSYPTYWRLTFVEIKRERGIFERPYLWYSYFLHKDAHARTPTPIELLKFIGSPLTSEESLGVETVDGLFSPSVALDGEARKDRAGVYRWKKREPKRR